MPERYSADAIKDRLLADPETRAEYDALADTFAIARQIIGARERAGLTQADLAARMGTTQSAVARWEGGTLPSTQTLKRIAAATGSRLSVELRDASTVPTG